MDPAVVRPDSLVQAANLESVARKLDVVGVLVLVHGNRIVVLVVSLLLVFVIKWLGLGYKMGWALG